jgi:cytochrome c553
MRTIRAACVSVAALGLAAAAAAGPGLAQQQAGAPPPAVADKAALCFTCHGADGLPVVPEAPILFGQHMFYLLTQLKDYRAERRAHDIMTPIAKDLTDEEMTSLATYFSEQPWPNFHEAASDEDKARAQLLAVEGACTQCHLGGMLGDSRNPRLSNQKPDYLIRTLTDFRDDKRKNAPAMAAIVRGWSDEDIAAMSRYLAGL